jgi:glycosyltransferase involved in cell wall biosynthesis
LHRARSLDYAPLVRIAIDARAAAEVPAGRGRYVRELIRSLTRIDADHEYVLYARRPWSGVSLDSRFRWEIVGAPGLSWPLVVGRRMSRSVDVALACTSYAITAPWRIPGAAIVWDFAPFDRSLRAPHGSLLERATLPIALHRCDALIAISEATRRELAQRFPQARAKATVAHPAADARFSPEPGGDDEAVLLRHGLRHPYVLVTGTLEPRKNLPRLIEAFAGLQESVRRGWTLALAGAAGWETDATFASAAAHGDLVLTLGYVPDKDLPALYRGAEVFCYPSLYEGFGIPVLEAMQSGTAVLTSSVSSMPEVGADAARYADPRDVRDIRRGLGELLSDPELRRRCVAAGIVQAGRFDWCSTARRVLTVLEGLSP